MNTKITKQTLLMLLVTSTQLLMAQNNGSLESFLNKKDSFLNGSDVAPKIKTFIEGDVQLHCQYDTVYDYWSGGFAISSMTDSITGDYTNLYSSTTATGANKSMVYAVGQNEASLSLTNSKFLKSIEIVNTAYAYISMLNGDKIGKKFTSADRDSFVVWVYGYKDSVLKDSSLIYLANFTQKDSAQAFILKDWIKVDFNALFSDCNNYKFILKSSDNSMFGMNTPSFFAVDNLVIGSMLDNIEDVKNKNIVKIYPNPSSGVVNINSDLKIEKVELFNTMGQLIRVFSNTNRLDLTSLDKGVYILSFTGVNGIWSGQQTFIKN